MRSSSVLLLMLTACAPVDGIDDPNDTDGPGIDGDTDGNGGGNPVTPDSELVDPTCLDGQWSETLPDTTADVSGVPFDDLVDWVTGVLDLRYPSGSVLVEGGLQNRRLGDCIQLFTTPQQRRNPAGMYGALSTITHECGHFHDLNLGGFRDSAYQLDGDVLLTCNGGGMGQVPARSRILEDEYSALRPPCNGRGDDCDFYADVYLDGDPDDGSFQGGDQGIDMLLEETVQYVHSLATDMAFADKLGNGSVSARDGILTFLWYVERYLRWTRLNDAQAYERIVGKPCWREVILSVWGRAWLYLDATEGNRRLGIADDVLEDLVLDPDLLQEIQRVRDAEGC